MSTSPGDYTLYVEKNSLDGDRIAITLLEKSISFDQVIVDLAHPPEDLLEINPNLVLPAIVTKEISLYHTDTILEFLNERYPQPALLPNDPISRAKFRLALHKIVNEWYPLIENSIESKDVDHKTCQRIESILVAYAPLFSETEYFQSDEFSLIDSTIAPFLWWINQLGIEIPTAASNTRQYAQRLLNRENIKEFFNNKVRLVS